jgi:hypothetical protein
MAMFVSGSSTSTGSFAYGTFGGYPHAGPWAPSPEPVATALTCNGAHGPACG